VEAGASAPAIMPDLTASAKASASLAGAFGERGSFSEGGRSGLHRMPPVARRACEAQHRCAQGDGCGAVTLRSATAPPGRFVD